MAVRPWMSDPATTVLEPVVPDKAGAGRAPRVGTSRDRFLLAAEDQFIAHGYDGCTIRAIAAQAGTSLASLSRNWTSKQHLFAEMLARHFDPIHAAQHARYDALEARGDLTVAAIAEAFFGSALGQGVNSGERSAGQPDTGEHGERSHRIYCLALLDPSEEARAITREMVGPVRARMLGLMRRALPDLDETRFVLAMNEVLGVYIYPQAHGRRLAGIMGFDITTIDWADAARTLAEMIAFGITPKG